MAKKNNINNSALSKLCSYIALASQQGQLINDTLQAQDKVFSSKHVTDLINSMSEQDKKYVDDIVANLNKLSSKTTSVIPDSSNAEPNTLYLYSADPNPTSYNQYMVLSDKTILDLGTTNISLEGYLKETDADSKYLKQVDSHSHNNKLILDSMSQDKIDKWDSGVSENKVKEIIDNERPITTTIDSTSTDIQIPSAKAVHDVLKKSVIVTDLDTFFSSRFTIGSGTAWNNSCANVPDGVTGAFVVVYTPYTDDGIYGVQTLICVQGISTGYSTFTRSRDNNNWKPWERLCTTKVADVPWTQLTMGSGMNGTVRYRVKNGICYVQVHSLYCSTMSTHSQTITSNLPVSELSSIWYTLDSNNATQGSLLVYINSTGQMINHIGVDNAVYYGSFSYPVAES